MRESESASVPIDTADGRIIPDAERIRMEE